MGTPGSAGALTIQILNQPQRNALAPGEVETPEYDNDFDRLLDARALHALRYLVDVGVLEPDGTGDVVVPEGLRGTVARGVAAAVTMLGGVPED